MLPRFDPIEARIDNARNFRVFDGGAEYNKVAHNRAKTFNGSKKNEAVGMLAEKIVGFSCQVENESGR